MIDFYLRAIGILDCIEMLIFVRLNECIEFPFAFINIASPLTQVCPEHAEGIKENYFSLSEAKSRTVILKK